MRTSLALTVFAIAAAPACAQILALDEYRVEDAAADAAIAVDGASAETGADAATLDAGADAASPADAEPLDGSPDADVADAALPDAGSVDASTADAAAADASTANDAGATDAAAPADAADSGPPPRLVFLDPVPNGIANVAADNTASLFVETNGFTLRGPGECRGEPNCGHAHVTIDGTTCNNVPAGKAYNAQLSAPGRVRMNMALCQAGPLGQKTVTVELVQDNHAPFTVREIFQATAFFLRGKVRFTNPLDEAVVSVPSNKHITVTFLVSDFTLKAPGQCLGAASCGHLRLTVDGANCNLPGLPYAALASSSAPLDVDLGRCVGGHLGTKTLRVELVADDGTPLNPIEANVAQVTFVP
jgi:hypothetical protein